MKKQLLLVALGLCSGFSFGQEFSLLNSSNELITVEHQFNELPTQTTLLNSTPYLDFEKTYAITSMKKGAPALPMFAESMILPNEGKASLVIEHDGYTEYQNVHVTPSKGNLKRNVSPSDVPYYFGSEYGTDAFYPAEVAKISEPYNLRNTRGITVSFSPYQYNPVTHTLRVYENVRAKVVVDASQTGLNELPSDTKMDGVFTDVYNNHYINATTKLEKYNPVNEEGEMLVITASQFESTMQPFVDWKIQSGIKTTMVNTSTAGSTDTQIKSYIQNFYSNNPNLKYVLLVGDHAHVPSHTYGTSGWEQLWSDSYYGQLTGGSNDFYPELFVGRFSTASTTQLTTQINRTLEYEKNPASGTWMERAIGLGSDEGAGNGDDGEPDWQHLRNIRTRLMSHNYTEVHEFYDGTHGGEDAPGNPNAGMIAPAVNEGVGLFNYTGHGDQNTCISGNYGSSDINSATNKGKYPFVISVACNNGTFTSGTCISETWMWATQGNSPTGSIAACGSSILMAWAPPMQVQDEMAEIIAEAYPNNKKVTLGGLFYNSEMSMLEAYSNNSSAKEVVQTWVFFGDPSTIFRNKQTSPMDVSHIGNVPLGTTSAVINCNVEDAKITIVQNGAIIGQGLATGGSATITFAALTSNQPLIVTAVKQNYSPYQGIITVADGPASVDSEILESINIYPVPADEVVNIAWDNSLDMNTIELMDLSGKVLVSYNASNDHSVATLNTRDLSSGVYVVKMTANGAVKTQKIIIK